MEEIERRSFLRNDEALFGTKRVSVEISNEFINYNRLNSNPNSTYSPLRLKPQKSMDLPLPPKIPKYERLNENIMTIREIKKLAEDTDKIAKDFKKISSQPSPRKVSRS